MHRLIKKIYFVSHEMHRLSCTIAGNQISFLKFMHDLFSHFTFILNFIFSCIIWLKYGLMIEDFPTIIVNTFGTILFSISNILYIYHAHDATLAERNLLVCASIVYIFLLLVNIQIINDIWVVPLASILMVLMSCSPFFDYLGAKLNGIIRRKSKLSGTTTSAPAHIYLNTSEQPSSSSIQLTKHHHPPPENVTHLPPIIHLHAVTSHTTSESSQQHSPQIHHPLHFVGENWSSSSTSQTLSFISFGGSFSWMLYGLCIHDVHIVVPNGLSTLLSIVQLIFMVKPGWAPQSPLFSRSFL